MSQLTIHCPGTDTPQQLAIRVTQIVKRMQARYNFKQVFALVEDHPTARHLFYTASNEFGCEIHASFRPLKNDRRAAHVEGAKNLHRLMRDPEKTIMVLVVATVPPAHVSTYFEGLTRAPYQGETRLGESAMLHMRHHSPCNWLN